MAAATEPTLRILSLGAGVQSTALLLLGARGQFGKLDAAIFADTGWEPRSVYAHLDRLEREVCKPAGIPLYRVSSGSIREDALNPLSRFAQMPMYVRGPCATCNGTGRIEWPDKVVWLPDEVIADVDDEDVFDIDPGEEPGAWVHVAAGSRDCKACRGKGIADGMARRQCTSEYKLKPIQRKVRELLGAKPREDGVPGRVPKGLFAEQWVGISLDEKHRALDTKSTGYEQPRWPLIEAGLSRSDCEAINRAAGFEAEKSACIGCPYHGNRAWRDLRDNRPEEWADAVAFDVEIRKGSARAIANGQELNGEYFLHRSRVPLDKAPIDRLPWTEWRDRQVDLMDLISAGDIEALWEAEDQEVTGCGPHTCRVGVEA